MENKLYIAMYHYIKRLTTLTLSKNQGIGCMFI